MTSTTRHGGEGGSSGIHGCGQLDAGSEPVRAAERGVLTEGRGVCAGAADPGSGRWDNPLSIAFPNGSRIVGLPENEGKVRGFSNVSLMLIDEASRVKDDLYRAMRPTLAVGDGDMLMMSTPFGQRGFFWEQWTQNAHLWERISVPASECPRISAKFLEEERTMLGERWFRQEYLCEFVDVNNSLFDRELLESAVDDSVAPLVFPSRRI